mmetsp:Transcript_79626/g.258026  ORF Transcript_79626/g.258026 Transcript_79626/m.258026 type:complete len:703 (-) Transcript_79626:1754-3862(-)
MVDEDVRDKNDRHLPAEARGIAVVRPHTAEVGDLGALHGRGVHAGRWQAIVRGLGEPVFGFVPAGLRHLLLPDLDLGPQKAAPDATRGGESCQHRQVSCLERMLGVTVHAVDAVELARRGEQKPEQGEQEDGIDQVDLPIPEDVLPEPPSVRVHVSSVHERQNQRNHANGGVVVVAAQHPLRGEQVDVVQRLELLIPRLRPQHGLGDDDGENGSDVGEDDARDCPEAKQCGGRPVAAQLLGGFGLRHGPDHDDANAHVHGKPHILPQAQSPVDDPHGADGRQCEGIDDEVLEGGEVRRQARSAFSDEVHDGQQRLPVAARGKGRDHRGLGVGEREARVRGPEAAAIVAAVAAHADDQILALKELDNVYLVLRLHAREDDQPRPNVLKLCSVAVQVPPGALSHSQLAVCECQRVDVACVATIDVGVPPLELASTAAFGYIAEQDAELLCDDPALPSDRDASERVVARADYRPNGALPQLSDRVRRVFLHLVAEEQQPTNAEARFQAVPRHVSQLLRRQVMRQALVRNAQDIVSILRTALRHRIVIHRHTACISNGFDLLIAALDVNLQLLRLRAADDDAAGHAMVVEVELLHDLKRLVSRRRRERSLPDRPAGNLYHGHLDLVADERPVAERRDGVAARERMPKARRHPRAHHLSILCGHRLVIALVGLELDPLPKPRILHRDHGIEVHSILRDGAGLVEDHR